ncbi:MAG: putative toxin-antitoxin system toxin component, PIN family [Clostridiales bacterium]|nr:putative toxin-antitoxin system toxin component, PIN family [Clostridiales bacterium]
MLKIVIDTNVVVSALLSPAGNAAQIIDRVFREDLKPCYCPMILAEYAAVLARPRFVFDAEDQRHLIEGIEKYGVQIEPTPCDIFFADESDRVFYEVAKAADAYLITGNSKHFPDEPLVINPAKCVSLLSVL